MLINFGFILKMSSCAILSGCRRMPQLSIIAVLLTTPWFTRLGDGFVLVCYYSHWAGDVPNINTRLDIKNINAFLCSHLVYAFADIDTTNFALRPSREDEVLPNGGGLYSEFVGLKNDNPMLKTMVSIGGGNVKPETFMTLFRDPQSRQTFSRNAIQFMRQHNFDGLDIDWEYPGDPPETKAMLTMLLQELRRQIDEEAQNSGNDKLILTIAAAAGEKLIEDGYDVSQISSAVDFINLMTYDFHGYWSKLTGFNSPLYSRQSDTRFSNQLSQEWAVNKWIDMGAPKEKLVLGMHGSGNTFNLTDRGSHRVGSDVNGAGDGGELRLLDGRMTYFEICRAFMFGLVYVWDEEQAVPYGYYGDQWIGFDDQRSIRMKTNWAMDKGLAGAMFWSLDFDDFKGAYCGQGEFPLVHAIRYTIQGIVPDTAEHCQMPPEAFRRAPHDPDFRVLCYFTNWSPQIPVSDVQFRLSNVKPKQCTHFMFSFAKINTNNLTLYQALPGDEYPRPGESQKPLYEQTWDMKKENPDLLNLLTIGGSSGGSVGFIKAVQNDESRARFAVNVIKFLRKNRFDGLDVDWEFPGEPPYTKEKFAELLQELRCQFEREAIMTGSRRLLLSVATSVSEDQLDAGYDMGKISRVVDFANLMAYDFMGPWNKIAGFNSPLFPRKDDRFSPELSQQWAVQNWIKKGLAPGKAILGLSAYGNTFTLKNKDDHGVGSPVIGAGNKGQLRVIGTHLAYFEICKKIDEGYNYEWDDQQKVPFAYYDDQWIGFDDPRSVETKTNWALDQNLGGVMLWSLDLDDFRGKYCHKGQFPLLKAMWKAINNSSRTTKPDSSTRVIPGPGQPTSQGERTTTPYDTKIIPVVHTDGHKHKVKTKIIILNNSAKKVNVVFIEMLIYMSIPFYVIKHLS